MTDVTFVITQGGRRVQVTGVSRDGKRAIQGIYRDGPTERLMWSEDWPAMQSYLHGLGLNVTEVERPGARHDPGERFTILNDGIDGIEISPNSVPLGSDAFQYALGSVEPGSPDQVYRRRANERGTYGGWRWETSPNKLLRRNALERDADHPIEVTKHYRSGPPGYLSPWQRAAGMGQNELFSTGIKLSTRAAEMRRQRNPGVTKAAYRSGLKEATAAQLGKLVRIGLRTGHTVTDIKADLKATGRFTTEQIARGIAQARTAEKKQNPRAGNDPRHGYTRSNPRRGARRAVGSQALSAAFRAPDSARGRLLRDVVSSGERRNPKQPEKIAFRVDKRGKLLAYRFSEPTYNAYGNWYRIGLDDAKLKIATGEAVEVDYDSQITSETIKRPYKRPGSEPIEDWPLASELVNPGGQAKRKAVKLYESFSGKRAKRQNTVSAPDGTPAHVAKLGTLRLIKTSDGRTWKFNGPGAPILAADHRQKLHVVGGQYRANPPDCECGEIVRIEYETDKPHLDQPTTAIYYHELGEETGERPILTIDNEGHMHIEGGAYTIEADGIHN